MLSQKRSRRSKTRKRSFLGKLPREKQLKLRRWGRWACSVWSETPGHYSIRTVRGKTSYAHPGMWWFRKASGKAEWRSNVIGLSENLDDDELIYVFLHEFTHLIQSKRFGELGKDVRKHGPEFWHYFSVLGFGRERKRIPLDTEPPPNKTPWRKED